MTSTPSASAACRQVLALVPQRVVLRGDDQRRRQRAEPGGEQRRQIRIGQIVRQAAYCSQYQVASAGRSRRPPCGRTRIRRWGRGTGRSARRHGSGRGAAAAATSARLAPALSPWASSGHRTGVRVGRSERAAARRRRRAPRGSGAPGGRRYSTVSTIPAGSPTGGGRVVDRHVVEHEAAAVRCTYTIAGLRAARHVGAGRYAVGVGDSAYVARPPPWLLRGQPPGLLARGRDVEVPHLRLSGVGGDRGLGLPMERHTSTSAICGAISRSARPRWEIASFSAGSSSAVVRPGCSSATNSTS